IGQTARLQIEGNSTSAATFTATVARINPSAQAGSRSVPVYLAVDNSGYGSAKDGLPALRQGLFVQGMLETGSADVLAVPLDAVRTDKPAPYVQLVQQGRVVHLNVQPGARSREGDQTLVAAEGLKEGMQVLTGRVGALPEGTVLVLPAAQSASPATAETAAAAAAAAAGTTPAPAPAPSSQP
ncbi:MAG: efflux transporter periplasmic adaptor subunit, partial [Giesbergeria sp.]|nr:efflux transporter periplasmic adaptor subunit [Giesbergeria sp.]